MIFVCRISIFLINISNVDCNLAYISALFSEQKCLDFLLYFTLLIVRFETFSKCCDNDSERSIRNIKIKQKVSGQFRLPEGSARFAILRSVTDTVLKNNLNVLGALNFIANFKTD